MSKEEILEMLSKCETKEDFTRADAEITKIKESGDIETANYLWNQLFMFEEGIERDKYQKDNKIPTLPYTELNDEQIKDIEYVQKNILKALKVPLKTLKVPEEVSQPKDKRMETIKIYVVSGTFSDWDDYYTRIFKAFYNKEDAEKYKQKADRILKAMTNHIAEAFEKTKLKFDDNNMGSFKEMWQAIEEYEKTDEFKLALDIWSGHSNLKSFNQCKIEEIDIV